MAAGVPPLTQRLNERAMNLCHGRNRAKQQVGRCGGAYRCVCGRMIQLALLRGGCERRAPSSGVAPWRM
eukprot:5824411-Prymnesium_polylepis.1